MVERKRHSRSSPDDALRQGVRREHGRLEEENWAKLADFLAPPDIEAHRRASVHRPGRPDEAEQSWPRWRSGGPATATDLAGRPPIPRQAIAERHLGAAVGAGLVTAEQGERRRARHRLRSAPMQMAQQFLAALARDWDSRSMR